MVTTTLVNKYRNFSGAFLLITYNLLTAISNSITHNFASNLSSWQILFVKSFVALLFLLLLINRKLPYYARSREPLWQLARGALGFMGNFSWILALQHLSLNDAVSLSMISSLISIFGAYYWLRENIGWQRWLCLLITLSGVLLILHPNINHFSWYSFLPLLTAFSYASSGLIVKYISRQREEIFTSSLYLLTIMTSVSLFPALQSWRPLDYTAIFFLIILGIIYLLNQLILVRAYSLADISFLAPFKFMRLPLNFLIGVLIFSEVPPIINIIGSGMIFVGGLLLISDELRRVEN